MKARGEVDRLVQEVRASFARIPLHSVRPEAAFMDEQRKLVTHAIRCPLKIAASMEVVHDVTER